MNHRKTRALSEGAVLIAVAQILGYIKIFEMPWGGSITLAMVPMILYAVRWGFVPGLLGGFVLGILQFVFDGGFALGWQSIVGDYLLAFTALGFAGLFRKKRPGVFLGSLVGGAVRFLVHLTAGATIWAQYMPDSFLGLTMRSPWFYSLLYNLCYMVPNIAVTLLAFLLLWKPMGKYLRGEDLA